MKKTNIIYWTVTVLFAAMMLLSSIPDILVLPDAVKFMASLGYPKYLIPFIGVAKFAGSVAILIPGLKRIKEWAYAGLFFDLLGATYSQLAIAGLVAPISFMLVPIIFGVLSYIFYIKKNSYDNVLGE